MLFNVTLPVLLTLPEKVNNWPGATGCVGHALVTTMPGVVMTGQVALAVLVTATPQALWPVAVKVSVTEQLLVGTRYLPVKVVTAPGASDSVVNTTVLAAG